MNEQQAVQTIASSEPVQSSAGGTVVFETFRQVEDLLASVSHGTAAAVCVAALTVHEARLREGGTRAKDVEGLRVLGRRLGVLVLKAADSVVLEGVAKARVDADLNAAIEAAL